MITITALLGCGSSGLGSADPRAIEQDSILAELKTSAPALTLWVRTAPRISPDDANPSITIHGRTSRNLRSVVASSASGSLGQVVLASPRTFDLTLAGNQELRRVLSGQFVQLAIETADGGHASRYVGRFRVEAVVGGFHGSSRLWVNEEILPVYVAESLADPLRHRVSVRTSRDVSNAVASTIDGRSTWNGTAWNATADRRNAQTLRFDLTTDELIPTLGGDGQRLVFEAQGSREVFRKEAAVRVAVSNLELREAHAPFLADVCEQETRTCLKDAVDSSECGRFEEVRSCVEAREPSCPPMLESWIAECVLQQVEDFANDVDREKISALDALELCTHEGDLMGPMLDEICASAPDEPYCACLGQEDCFEAFAVDFVEPCATTVEPRFDCALGLTFRDIRDPPPTIVHTEERVVRIDDVTDGLLAAQILASAGPVYGITTLEEAFQSVDRHEVNLISFWEGTNGVPYTAIEYGAGDNSYGSVFAWGTTELRAIIGDSDLYDASAERRLGCRIPFGPRWSRCWSQDGCANGFRCEGVVLTYDEEPSETHAIAPGKCVESIESDGPEDGAACTSAQPCSLGAGFACSSAIASNDDGLCRPLWMFGGFAFPESMSIPASGTERYSVTVYGLATVAEEAVFTATLNYTNFTKLKLSLANPQDGTTSTFFDGPALGAAGVHALLGGVSGEFRVKLRVPVPGDEEVNGEWRLIVDTTSRGERVPRYDAYNIIYGDPTLTISSRYD
ncbi:MAG: hypothetical protein IPK13_25015 [Deltaproteobacteria bacterium]|nr:hypothetical protein [Deltaproteobacteria bacterium]